MPDVDTGPMTPLDEWKLRLAEMAHAPTILHCGAKPWDCLTPEDPRVHCERGTWVTTDIAAGEGVDIVGDLQTMWQTCARRFDAIYCVWTLEHVSRPWVAMHSMAELLDPGGVLFVNTHQTFPLHGYPQDYFRFSKQAMELMASDSKLDVLSCAYDSPCTITPPSPWPVWNPLGKAFLHVSLCARRPG